MISIIIPFYNEVESLPVLYQELVKVLDNIKEEYEIIFVDDGSDKDQKSKIPSLSERNTKVIIHRKRFGKGEALKTGLTQVKGDKIVFMDADLQDDPKDIESFVNKINEGYDLVNGIRKNRQDNPIIKIYSFFANYFLRIFLKSPFTDINCGFKVFKKSILDEIVLYGNNFRFFPLDVYYKGFKVAEIVVNNRERKYGKSKFGIQKLFIGIFDTLTAVFLYKFSEQPLHFFGVIGGTSFFIGFLISAYLSIERIFFGIFLYRRPMLWLGLLLIIVGIQIIMTGIIGELIVYVNKKNK